jgi:hypothetical protein
MEKIVEVWVPRTEEFKAKMDKMVRKAAKLDCGSLGYEQLDGKVVRVTTNEGGLDEKHSYTQFRVWGAAPKVEGWMFVAALHHVQGQGTLVHGLDDIEFPEHYRTSDKPLCEHCNTRRIRKDTYLVMNEDSGEFKQVGSSCLRDFLGHDNPSQIAAMCGLIQATDVLEDEFGFNPGMGSYYREYALGAVLAMAVMFIRKEGRYISNSEAKASEEDAHWTGKAPLTSTSTMVRDAFDALDILRIRQDEESKQRLVAMTPTEQDEAAAEAARSWVANEREAKSNFDHNLKMAAGFELADARSLGIACYIVPAHQKYLAKEAARKLAEQYGESEHVGTIKKRQVFTLTLTHKFDIEGFYGTTTIHKFRDPDGNVVVWFASNPNIAPDDGVLEVGHTYDIKATPKEHKEYKGTKETAVNRAAFVCEHSNGDKQAA